MILRPEGTQSITSTGSTSISKGVGLAIVGTGGTLATSTITFPPTPNDRDNFMLIFNGIVTTLSLLGGGITITGTLPITAALGLVVCYQYDAASNKWYRLY